MRLSNKDFKKRLAIFEGDNKNKKLEIEKNNKIISKSLSQSSIIFDNDINKNLNKTEGKKGQKSILKNDNDLKDKINNKHNDLLMLERLKLNYNLIKKEEKKNTSINNSNNLNDNSKNNLEKTKENNNVNSKEEEIKYINNYIEGIRKKDSFSNINEQNFPKKLNLKEIYRKMNIDQIASNVNEDKRKELMRLSLAKKEEEKKNERSAYYKQKEGNLIKFDFGNKNKNKINDTAKFTDEKTQKNVKDIKKEEKQTKNESSKGNKKFLTSLIDIYDKKHKTIDYNEKKVEKQINRKNQLLNTNKPHNETNKTNETKNTPFELYINTEDSIFLEEKIIYNNNINKIIGDKFCECFFLVSFPKENGKVAPDSENLPSDCRHEICSKIPAMEPDIIFKYPENNKNFEINNLAASICFPNGIKLCYEENEENIQKIKNYRSTLTNQNGKMFFVYTYHFYVKMANEDLRRNYSMYPIRYQLTTYQDELCTIFTDELEENIVNKLEIYSDCNFKENVYIPFCLGLISKYPYYPQLDKSLASIFESIKSNENDTNIISNLIMYLLKSIPIPPKNSKVSFALPYINKICEINYPYFQDSLLFGNDPAIILEKLSIMNIICIFKLILFEQRILVVGENMDRISEIILNFISLLYPFEWVHTFIPVMSMKMLKYLESFLPFLNGMNLSLFEVAKSFLSKTGDVFIINIDEDNIEISNNLQKNDKSFKGINYINKTFPPLPKGIENIILKELKLIKIELEKYKNYNIFDKEIINNRIRNLFFQVFIEILYDYEKYTYTIDDYPVINAFSLINDKPKADKKFYEELTSSQMFRMFVQKSLFNEDLNLYFTNKMKEFAELKKKGISFGEIINIQSKNIDNEYRLSKKIDKNYIIKPTLIPNYKEFEKEMKSQNKSITFKDIHEFLFSQTFNDDKETNQNENRKNNQIIDELISFSNIKEPSSYTIFLIPNKLINNNKEKNLDEFDTPNLKRRFKRSSTKIKIISGQKENVDEIRYSCVIKEKDDELNQDQKDEIIDNIKDIMKKVYESKLVNIEENQEILMDSVGTKFGRDYFINIISAGNKKSSSIKIVENESFNFLKYIIFNVLLNILKLEENYYSIISALKLTKACLYIKTMKNKKEVSLSDEIFSQLEEYSLYKNRKFWEIWIEDEFNDDELKIYHTLKSNSGESHQNNEKYHLYNKKSYEIIDKLLGIMIELKLPNFLIYSTFSELCREYILDKEQFSKLMKEMIYYQKLSKK